MVSGSIIERLLRELCSLTMADKRYREREKESKRERKGERDAVIE